MPEVRVNGIRLYYEEHGEGQPILCIHGSGSSALLWASAVELLARMGRVISTTGGVAGGAGGRRRSTR